jgi:hypothetical protein
MELNEKENLVEQLEILKKGIFKNLSYKGIDYL